MSFTYTHEAGLFVTVPNFTILLPQATAMSIASLQKYANELEALYG